MLFIIGNVKSQSVYVGKHRHCLIWGDRFHYGFFPGTFPGNMSCLCTNIGLLHLCVVFLITFFVSYTDE